MVDKRSLRSSKKDQDDTPVEEEKPKPTRTRSARSRKASSKNAESTPSEAEDSAPPTTTETTQPEDIVMETAEPEPAAEKLNEDVEMKNGDDASKEEKKEGDEPKEDPTASPLTSNRVQIFISLMRILVIKQNLQLLEKAVNTLDPRFTYRVLKMSNLRKRLSAEVLVQVVREVY